MQDGVVESAGVDKASDNHCSLFTSSRKNRHGLPLSRYLRYLLTCPLPFLSVAKSMKCLCSSRRSDATSSLIHSFPSHAHTHHFQCGGREADPTSGLLAGDSSVVHTRPYGVVCNLVKRYHVASGICQLSLVWSMRSAVTVEISFDSVRLTRITPSANKEISFDLSLPRTRGIPMGQALHDAATGNA
jgi:hypothetical protein